MPRNLLERLGLHRAELRAWASYDIGSSAFATSIATAIFPAYFVGYIAGEMAPAQAVRALAIATALFLLLIAMLSPLVGRWIDRTPKKKATLMVATVIGSLCCVGLAFVDRGEMTVALTLVGLANVSYGMASLAYDALLRSASSLDEVDAVSASGYALGYLGGGVLLALQIMAITMPGAFGLASANAGVRAAFVSVGFWWLLFSIPLWVKVAEPPVAPNRAALNLRATFVDLKRHPDVFRFLIAFLLYNDGIATVARMATAYGTELGLPRSAMITAILIVQFVGVPCTFAFAIFAKRFGGKVAIYIGIGAYVLISIVAYFMTAPWHFFLLASLVGIVQGGCLAMSRSLFASMIPAHKAGAFFGVFSSFARVAAVIGPLLFALSVSLTDSSRAAALSLAAIFLSSMVMLARVNVKNGRALVAESHPG